MIAIISNNESFIKHISSFDKEYFILNDDSSLGSKYELLIIEDKIFATSVNFSKLKTLVLSETPEFSDAMKALEHGARGYGNTYMSLVHLNQAIETIKNEAVWLYPKIMNKLISHGSKLSEKKESTHLQYLSQREKDVALEIQEGKSNKEIAVSLEITERTVKAHLSHIFEKLDVHDRLALAMLLRT